MNAKIKFIGRSSYEQPAEVEDDYIEEDFEEDKSDSIEDLEQDEEIEDRLMRERQEQQER